MTSLLGRIFRSSPAIEAPAPAPDRFAVAMADSGALLARMRSAYGSNDAVRQVLADIWQQHHNIPYVTTIFETTQELNSPVAYPLSSENRGK